MTETYRQDPLWLKLEAMELDEKLAPIPFSKRFQIETGWTAKEVARSIEEYRRFLYLMAKAGHSLWVPHRVGEVWRFHLIYSQHYRDVLCDGILGFMLHRDPVSELRAATAESAAHYSTTFKQPWPKMLNGAELPSAAGGIPPEIFLLCLLPCWGLFTAIGEQRVWHFVSICLVLALTFGALSLVLLAWIETYLARTYNWRFWATEMFALRELKEREPNDDPLWQRLTALDLHNLGAPGPTLSEQLHDIADIRAPFASLIIEQYRRFLYLSVRADHRLTPSTLVDDAWHIHMSHSRNYWETLCGETLRTEFHHTPATGQAGQTRRHYIQYCLTLQSYRRIFGCSAPLSIWPLPYLEWLGFSLIAAAITLIGFSTVLMGRSAMTMLEASAFTFGASALAAYYIFVRYSGDEARLRLRLIARADRRRPSNCG